MAFGYEIEFLPVGDGEKSGDAIAVHYGEAGARTIMVVDGGTLDSGQQLIDHINQYYGNPSHIHHVVCTHPDDDHSSGLREVIKAFTVGAIWLHRPWLYADQLVDKFKGNWSVDGLKKRLKDDFPIIAEISNYADANGIPVYAPFQGENIGDFVVMSPSLAMYLELVPQFSRTPDPVAVAEEALKSAFGGLLKALKEVIKWVTEPWSSETLKEDDTPTSPSNESSVILYADFEGKRCLLTGDAGIRALSETCDYADASGRTIGDFRFTQIPHHGSRHNVSPTVLNRLIGPIVAEGDVTGSSAFASAAKASKTHPRRVVLNAYRRRGVMTCATNDGYTKRHYDNMPEREGWSAATMFEFYPEVEGE